MECRDLEIVPLKQWAGSGDLLVMAGPCSAESREQILTTARMLARDPRVRIFRAGVWKPRTRPNTFEGWGHEALAWIAEAGIETGLLTAVEVGTPQHVEEALKHGIKVVWIGARTTVNPFMVKELASAMKGSGLAVMVKNPVNPDPQLWIGAIERIHQAGIQKLAAIHRGFYFFKKSPWRNAPMWEIPIELKRICPHLPIITDPSHMSGKAELIAGIAQKALDLEMDGLMIEVHPDPPHAFTDSAQQITPDTLFGILDGLKLRNRLASDFDDTLERLRLEIDKLDQELLEILARRMNIIDEIGIYKKNHSITILQLKRWRQMLAERMESGTHLGLDASFLTEVLQLVHEESIRRQQQIMDNGNKNQPA
ncbi:MAG: chorismate mutase [Bacteroidales bacterium]